MLVLILTLMRSLSSSTLLATLSDKDIEISTNCMKNIHPCVPETLDCSNQFYSTSKNLLESINELLFMINQDYSENSGSFKRFPGIQSGALTQKASSIYNYGHNPDMGRYYFQYLGIPSAWFTSIQNADQYYQVGSSIPFIYEGMLLSCAPEGIYFISSYRLNYSVDGSTWIPYDSSKIFKGITNNILSVKQIFEPFIARAVRVIPVTVSFEFYISKPIYKNVLSNGTLISALSSGFKVTVSSIWNSASNAFRIHLDTQESQYVPFGGWCAGFMDINQWIMITSARPVLWKKVAMLGESKNDNWIRSFYIMYSEDGSSWNYYKNKQIFNGNRNRNTLVECELEGFIGISIRIHPLTWNNAICARLEAYCYEV